MPVPATRNEIVWADYERLTDINPAAIVWASAGGNGCGKSAFGLTAPDPIFVCAFDIYGMNRVGPQFKLNMDGTKKDIRIARYPFSPREYGKDKAARSKAANATWEQFVYDYRIALRNSRTVLWDREDLMWELLRYASFGEVSSQPSAYADLNMEYVSLIQEGFAASVNLGIMRGIREEWISKWDAQKAKMVPHNTGVMIPDGMKKIPDHVDITLVHRWDDTARAYVTLIDKFTNPAYKGKELPNFTFLDMALAAYPDKDPLEWGDPVSKPYNGRPNPAHRFFRQQTPYGRVTATDLRGDLLTVTEYIAEHTTPPTGVIDAVARIRKYLMQVPEQDGPAYG